MTVRTDRLLQAFFDRVDALVGLDHTLVILTADYGVARPNCSRRGGCRAAASRARSCSHD